MTSNMDSKKTLQKHPKYFKRLQKAVEHGGLLGTCDRAYAIIILEDFTFKVLALVLSASQCLKFPWDLERS